MAKPRLLRYASARCYKPQPNRNLEWETFGFLAHWVWNGLAQGETLDWLGRLGFVDFAGSTVVHSIGGWVSLATLLHLAPRLGRLLK